MKLINWLRIIPPRAKRVIAAAAVCLLLFFVYPFQTTIVPAWNLGVVDEHGDVVTGIKVTQHWQHNLLESIGHEQVQTTNEEGQVTFPARTIRASLISRGTATLVKFLKEGRDAKLGPYSSIVVWGSKDNETNVAVYSGEDLPPSRIVAARTK